MATPASHPVTDRLDQLEHNYHAIAWIFVAQLAIIFFMMLFLLWSERRTRRANADYFTGYHRAMHEAMDKDAKDTPVLPPRSLKSTSGHPVVSEPIRVPADSAEPVTVIQPAKRGSHRAAGPAK